MSPETRSETPSPFPQVRQPSLPVIDEEDHAEAPEGPDETTGQYTPSNDPVANRALRIGLENRRSIGKPSIPATKQKASGLFLVVEDVGQKMDTMNVDMTTKFDRMSTKLDGVVASVTTATVAGERRMGYVSSLGEKILNALVPLIIVGVVAYLTGHLHWSTTTVNPPVPPNPQVTPAGEH